jgi:hypothetical protein
MEKIVTKITNLKLANTLLAWSHDETFGSPVAENSLAAYKLKNFEERYCVI